MAKNKYAVSPGKGKLGDAIKKKGGTSKVELSAGFTVLDLLVGAALGGLTGAALGRWSLLAGAALNFAGNYWEQHAVSSFGVGMMASGFQAKAPTAATNGVDGTDDLFGLADAKDRAIAYGKGFAQKMWLDKFIPSLKPAGVNGLGEVQYFVYPNENPVGAIDMSALDQLEAQVSASAQQYSGKQQVSGLGYVDGFEGLDDDKIY